MARAKGHANTHEAPAADANLHAINETNVLSGQRKERANERESMELSDEPAGCFYLGGPRQRMKTKTKTKKKTTMTATATTTANDVTCVADNAPGLIHS